MGVMNPGLVMRNIIPVVMAGVLGIYGLIVAVIIQGSSKTLIYRMLSKYRIIDNYVSTESYRHFPRLFALQSQSPPLMEPLSTQVSLDTHIFQPVFAAVSGIYNI